MKYYKMIWCFIIFKDTTALNLSLLFLMLEMVSRIPRKDQEVEEQDDDVAHLAADELEEVPAVVVEDGLEVLDVLLYDRFENYPVVVVALFLQQDR